MAKKRPSEMIEKKAKKEENGTSPVTIAKASLTYEGPLPHPMILAEYERLYPGATQKIIEDFTKNTAHIRDMETMRIESEIEERKRGQWMAFGLSLSLISLLAVTVILDFSWSTKLFAAVIAIAGVAKALSVHKKK